MRKLVLVLSLLLSGCDGCGVEWCEVIPGVPCEMMVYIAPPIEPIRAGQGCRPGTPDICRGSTGDSLQCDSGGVWRKRDAC